MWDAMQMRNLKFDNRVKRRLHLQMQRQIARWVQK